MRVKNTSPVIRPEGKKDHLSQPYQVVKPEGERRLIRSAVAVKPINWKGITDRHHEESNIRGEFGEQIVKEFLEHRGYHLEKQQNRAPGLPDFRIDGTSVFVEVKAHKSRTPPIWQKPWFGMMVKMGWKILVAQPHLKTRKESVVCSGIDWYDFDNDGHIKRLKGFSDRLVTANN